MRQRAIQQGAMQAPPQPFSATVQEQAQSAPKAAAPAAELRREAQATAQTDATLDSITVTGSRVRPDTSDILPHWREDARLAPDEWLERIRERVRRGDRQSAASSLRRFTLQHPSVPVPDDLTLLLVK